LISFNTILFRPSSKLRFGLFVVQCYDVERITIGVVGSGHQIKTPCRRAYYLHQTDIFRPKENLPKQVVGCVQI
jgi:hypothetical protein